MRADSNRWETVAVFTSGIAAHAARTKLESEGIECFVADEHMVGANPLYSNAIGGVKLQVSPADLARAREALSGAPELVAGGAPEPAEAGSVGLAPSAREAERFNRSQDLRCPKCSNDQLSRTQFSGKVSAGAWLLGSLALMIPLPWLGRKSWKCKSCGHAWRVKGR